MQFRPTTFIEDFVASQYPDAAKRPADKEVARGLERSLLALQAGTEPYDVADAALDAYLTCAVNAVATADDPAALADRAAAAQALSGLSPQAMLRVVDALGTLAPKLEEPKIGAVGDRMPVALFHDPAACPVTAEALYPSCRTLDSRVQLTSSANAGDNRIAKLYCTRFARNGDRPAALIDRIADTDTRVFDALVALGLDAEALDAVRRRYRARRAQGLDAVSALDHRMNVLFVPFGGDYLQVTPVPSAAVFTELAARVRARRRAGSRIPASQAIISSKPQNACLHLNYEVGRVTRFAARYRAIDAASPWRKLRAVQHGAPFFSATMLADVTAVQRYAALVAPRIGDRAEEAYQNRDIRDAIQRHGRAIAAVLAAELKGFRSFCLDAAADEIAETPPPGWLGAFARPGRPADTPGALEGAAEAACTVATAALQRADDRLGGAAGLSDQLRRDLTGALHDTFMREID
jgi:hypothetical protein